MASDEAVDSGSADPGPDEPAPTRPIRHPLARAILVGGVAVVVFLVATLFTGFPPLHMASASDLIAFRDRINEATANPTPCPFSAPPAPARPAEIDWIGRHIRLPRTESGIRVLPGSLRYTAAEKRMLGPGPVLESVGCPAIGDVSLGR